MAHRACEEIKFADPTEPSDALVLFHADPNDIKAISKIQGFICFIPLLSMVAARDIPTDVIPCSDQYFITTCFEANTKLLKAGAIFSKNRTSFGVVVGDCSTRKDPADGVPQKICLNGSGINQMLNRLLQTLDWKVALSNKLKTRKQNRGSTAASGP